MSTNPGISIADSASVEAWIESLPDKEPAELLRDQVILLNAIQQSLVLLQRGQIKIQSVLEELSDLQSQEADVRVRDVDMSFSSMVVLIIKWALAMIPAALILAFLGFLIALGLSALGWLPPFVRW